MWQSGKAGYIYFPLFSEAAVTRTADLISLRWSPLAPLLGVEPTAEAAWKKCDSLRRVWDAKRRAAPDLA